MRRESGYGSLRASRFVERASPGKVACSLGSDLDFVHQTAVEGKAGGQQRPTEAATGVQRGGEVAQLQAGMLRAEPAHHPAIAAVRTVDGSEATAAPPEAVLLGFQRPPRLEACVDEQEAPAGVAAARRTACRVRTVGVGGAAQAAE